MTSGEASRRPLTTINAPVVIGVDAHKQTHTLVAIDDVGRKLAERTVRATDDGHADAIRWARRNFAADVVWGLEDCRQVSGRFERQLLAAGARVIRCPTRLMAATRRSSRERGKSDAIDALNVARAVQREPDLPVAYLDGESRDLNLLVARREVLVEQRSAAICRALWQIHEVDPARGITGAKLTTVLHRQAAIAWLGNEPGLVAELARDELIDVARLSEVIDALTRRIEVRVRVMAPTLLEMFGVGELTAAKIVGEAANVTRFVRGADSFSQYAGVAPIPFSSGQGRPPGVPVRIGNRQLNRALHTIAMVQIRWGHAGKAYYQRRLDSGDSPAKARRALKRRIAHAVFRRLLTDQRAQQAANFTP